MRCCRSQVYPKGEGFARYRFHSYMGMTPDSEFSACEKWMDYMTGAQCTAVFYENSLAHWPPSNVHLTSSYVESDELADNRPDTCLSTVRKSYCVRNTVPHSMFYFYCAVQVSNCSPARTLNVIILWERTTVRSGRCLAGQALTAVLAA